MEDATLTEIDADRFAQVAAQKVCAAKIPVTAVCYRQQRPDLIQPWSELIDTLGCWHQMMNDLFDWQKDSSYGNVTFFLSEGKRRRQAGETMTEWVIREGFDWGSSLLHDWMNTLQQQSRDLDCPELTAYLQERQSAYQAKEAEVKTGFRGINALLTALKHNPAPIKTESLFDYDLAWDLELL